MAGEPGKIEFGGVLFLFLPLGGGAGGGAGVGAGIALGECASDCFYASHETDDCRETDASYGRSK